MSNLRIFSLVLSFTALISHTAFRFNISIILMFTTVITTSGIKCKTRARNTAKVFVTVILYSPKGAEIAKAIIHISNRNENLAFFTSKALENCALIGEHTMYQRSTLNAAKQNMEMAYAKKRTAMRGRYSVQNVFFSVSLSSVCSVACLSIFSAEKKKSATATLRSKRWAILRIFLFEKTVGTIKRLPKKATERAVNSTTVKIGSRVSLRERSDNKSLGGNGPKHETFPCTAEQFGEVLVKLSICVIG